MGRHALHEEPVWTHANDPAGGTRAYVLPPRNPPVLRAPRSGAHYQPRVSISWTPTTGQWGREWDGGGPRLQRPHRGRPDHRHRCRRHEPDGARSRFRLAPRRHSAATATICSWPRRADSERSISTKSTLRVRSRAPLNEFDSEEEDPPAIMATVRETACEQGLFYRDRMQSMIDEHGGNFVYLQDGEVKWSGENPCAHQKPPRVYRKENPAARCSSRRSIPRNAKASDSKPMRIAFNECAPESPTAISCRAVFTGGGLLSATISRIIALDRSPLRAIPFKGSGSLSIERPEDFEGLAKAGQVVAATLREMAGSVRAGVTTADVDRVGELVLKPVRRNVRTPAVLRFSRRQSYQRQ